MEIMGLPEALSQRRIVTECIEVPKVYDFCFQRERRESVCFNLRPGCMPPVGSTVRCTILFGPPTNPLTFCREVSRTEPDKRGFSNVTVAVQVTARIEILDPEGRVLPQCTIAQATFPFTKTVTLCAPAGTEIICTIADAACGPCVLFADQVCCNFDLCLIFQSVAVVKLLVLSLGFCEPAECAEVAPVPPIVCPPVPLFPPQCPSRPPGFLEAEGPAYSPPVHTKTYEYVDTAEVDSNNQALEAKVVESEEEKE